MSSILQNPFLVVDKLTFKRGHRTLFSQMSFTVEPGENLTCYGQNGVGKSTLLRLIAGFLEPDSGTVKINALSENFQLPIGYMGHIDGLKSSLTPLDHLKIELGISSLSKTTIEEREQALRFWGVPAVSLHQPIASLSCGQRKRVALALLTLKRAQCWILDEPFVGLDQEGQAKLEQVWQNHCSNGGIVFKAQHVAPTIGRGIRIGKDDNV